MKALTAILATVLIAVIALMSLFIVFGGNAPTRGPGVLAAPREIAPLTVTALAPASAPNDLDTPIVITGTGFTAELSGTLVITAPSAYLGETSLVDVTWVSSGTLEAVVPWGLDPGVYTLTVVNPGGEAASLTNAFTVTQGINTWTTGGPYGGWIVWLALGDEQGETVYATVGNVGVFRSRDGGESWELIFIENDNYVTVDPTNLNRLYIHKNRSERQGLYRSEDGGNTWTAMPQPIPGVNPRAFLAFVNPHDGTLFGALRADLGSPSCDFGCGLFRFDEMSQTWDRLEESGLLNENTGVTAVAFDPQDPNALYAGLLDGTVIQSTDGGQTWAFHSALPINFIRELVVNPVSGELWVCGPLDGTQTPGGLYRYVGNDWVLMYSSPQGSTNVRNIIFDPDATNAQSQHIWFAAIFDGVLESDDGGQTWMHANPNRAEAVALNPKYPAKIYSGSNEGVSKTNDGGVIWQTINEGLTGIVPYNMGASPHDAAVVFGVADSIGIIGSRNGGETWQRRTVSTGGPIVVDSVNPLHVVNADYNMFHIADDGWNFNREIPIFLPPGMATEDYSAIPNAMIARPGMWLMGVGYGNRTLPYWNYEGGGGIYLSEDGENWSPITSLLECPPTSLGFDPVDDNIIYAATSGMRGGVSCEGTFLRSTDGGQTWQESTAGLPYYSGSGYGGGVMAVEPTPPYRIFLGNFVSSDQGVTWSEVNSPSESYIRQMLFLPGSPSILYAATGAGLFRTVDGAQTWQRAQGAMGQLEIWSLAGTTIDERQVLYVALVGGAVESDSLQALGLASDNEQLINAGVYRYTMLPPQRIFLPMILNIQMP